MNRSSTSVLCSALAFTVTVGSFFLPTLVSVANGQSPMNMMSKMMMGGNGDNETGDGMMQMMGGNMSRMPFKMGVLAMPLMCSTPGDIISGQFEADAEGNEIQDMTMNEMIQQMMMAGNGSNGMNSNSTEADPQELQNAMNMNNMTDSEAELEQAMSMNICFPMMDERMMKEIMGVMGWG